jgi:3D-(3,5/4)-trihydroxycyclohexane-1,2-dione acylhydrolase (decyclizing)
LGAHVIETTDLPSLKAALQEAKKQDRTTVIVIETDREERVPGYESWWDVAVAEVSEMESVQMAFEQYQGAKEKERYHL